MATACSEVLSPLKTIAFLCFQRCHKVSIAMECASNSFSHRYEPSFHLCLFVPTSSWDEVRVKSCCLRQNYEFGGRKCPVLKHSLFRLWSKHIKSYCPRYKNSPYIYAIYALSQHLRAIYALSPVWFIWCNAIKASNHRPLMWKRILPCKTPKPLKVTLLSHFLIRCPWTMHVYSRTTKLGCTSSMPYDIF